MLESLSAKDADGGFRTSWPWGTGLVLFVVREAVGDRTSVVQEPNLFDMLAKYAVVVGLSEAKLT
jgi:hypothetical protein